MRIAVLFKIIDDIAGLSAASIAGVHDQLLSNLILKMMNQKA